MRKNTRLVKAFSVLTALMIVASMLLSLVVISPSFAYTAEEDVAQETASASEEGKPLDLEPVEAVPVEGKGVVLEPKDAKGPADYIILLDQPPVASYRGGINGLAATNPAVRGEAKLDANSPESQAYASYLEGKQADFLSTVESTLERELKVSATYQFALNGVAVELTPEEAAEVAGLPGVKQVQRSFLRYPQTDVGPQWINADSIWDGSATGTSTKGEGVVVGVIDTGLNLDHPSFAEIGPIDNYTHTNPLGDGNFLGLCDSDPGTWVCNNKTIGYYIFTGETHEDQDGHGSHTASTSAGNLVTATLDITATNPYTYVTPISGVAPHANIIGYDACDDTGGCPLTALADAIDQATADGVDVINYSIGGGSSDPWTDSDSLAFLAAADAGIIPVTSAGNSGPGAGTVGSPGDAPWMLTVGASTHNRAASNGVINMSGGDTTPPSDLDGAGLGVAYGPADIVYAGDYGDALCLNPFPPGTWSGEIVVCDRGQIARVAKGQNVLLGGAGGFVLANTDADGESIAADPHVLPGVHIGDTAGDQLRTWLASGSGHTAEIAGTTLDFDAANGDIMAGFSSRGPNVNTAPSIIKPDVTAPGVSILAAYRSTPVAGDASPWMTEFNFVSGTSMSSPHTAGAAALMRSLYPGWSPAQIKSALMSTAMNDGVLKDDGTTPADPFDMGGGRVDLSAASQAGLVFDVTTTEFEDADPALGGNPQTLNLPSLGNHNCVQECSWTREVQSTSGVTTTWTAMISAPTGMTVTVTPNSFELTPGATQVFTVTADVSGLPEDNWAFAEVSFYPPILWEEGFEDNTWPPTGWSSYVLTGTGWVTGTTGTSSSHGDAHSGDYYVWHDDEFGAQDAWLVSSPFTPTAGSQLNFWYRNYYLDLGFYGYSGALISTGSCDPNDGEFVELAEYDAHTPDWTEATLSLDAYADQSVCVGFQYTGDFEHEWYIDDVAVLGPGGDASPAHMPVAVVPTTGSLPQMVDIETRRDAGSTLLEDLEAIEITDLTVETFGLTAPTLTDFSLNEDSTNGDPYDNLDEVFHTIVTVPAGTERMVAEIIASEAPDIDLFWGADTNGNGLPDPGEELGSSTTPSWDEYLSALEPAPGDYWVLVQNWAGSSEQPDDVTLAMALVEDDTQNMMIEGPSSVSAGTPFDLRLYWDVAGMMEGDRYYGVFTLGSDAANAGNIGSVPVNLVRLKDDVSKMASQNAVQSGDMVTYTITVEPNVTAEDLTYYVTDTIPAGMTYVNGSAQATAGSVGVTAGGVLTWTGVMPTPVGAEGSYDVTTSATDPSCDTGFGGYVNLEDFGIFPQSGITGDTAAWTAFTSGDPISFFGDDYTGMSFTDDGFAVFDVANNYGGSPWVPQMIPDGNQPNAVAAPLWHDFEIFYDSANNHGVSLATSGAPGGLIIVEYDDIQFFGGSSDTFDFEVVVARAVDDAPGAYEIVFAYDNLSGDLTGDFTIGVENAPGTTASALVNNASADGVISDGFMVCMDYSGPNFDPVQITYQVTVDAGASFGDEFVNAARHTVDAIGAKEAVASATVTYDESHLAVGHLAPFAMDPGTAVTVTLDGTAVLTDFMFAESTGYLGVPSGMHDVAIYPAGAATPAVTGTVDLMAGMEYSAIAVGDGMNQPLDLMVLEDDNTAPITGTFKLRLGHLAPFTDTITNTVADIRLQDGSPVITGVPYGVVAGYMELPAGVYDLKVTTPGGGETLIDPSPVTFNAGDIVSAFAVGDGMKQDLGVFAWPADQPGFLLPIGYEIHLPVIFQAPSS